MRKNKLTHLLEPGMRLYFVFLLLFAAASALFSVPIAVIEAAVVLVLLSVVLTLIGGLIPSRKAAKQDPVKALRTE